MKPLRALRKDRWLLALGVVAVLVHLFASQLMAHAVARPAGAEFTAEICTSQGLAALPAAPTDAGPTDSGGNSPNHGAACCDLCGSCSALALPTAAADGPALAVRTAAARPQPPASPTQPPAYRRQAPRGPPLFS